MAEFEDYYTYLKSRSRLGGIYRKYWLYPMLSRHLFGLTLDVGCGIGDMLAFRRNTVGVDINPRTVEFCVSRGLDARVMTDDQLPFMSEQFDSVLLDNVLEHIERPAPLLGEIRRVLKKTTGVFLVGVPGIKGWATDSDHKVFYDEGLLIGRLSQFGFRHLASFYPPLGESEFLSRKLRQYCLYAKFSPDYPDDSIS